MRAGIRISSLMPSGLVIESVSDTSLAPGRGAFAHLSAPLTKPRNSAELLGPVDAQDQDRVAGAVTSHCRKQGLRQAQRSLLPPKAIANQNGSYAASTRLLVPSFSSACLL